MCDGRTANEMTLRVGYGTNRGGRLGVKDRLLVNMLDGAVS